MTIDIRQETTQDRPRIRDIILAAFDDGTDGEDAVEAALTDALFADDGYLLALSLVAVDDGEIVGFVIGTRGWVGDDPAIGIGPLAVIPHAQGGGIGSALMTRLIDDAAAAGEHVLALLGDPEYYARFGFRTAADLGIEAPDPEWGRHFQALRIPEGQSESPIRGTFRYAAPFDEL
ncbi:MULTISPECIES: GNAT family N-acetyltransferase [Gordonia]|jgi:predicted N-acetyltransferase YhbS|uniref:GNAT family N-acetyltransferase n=1 Tax=Gordonia TaxID=2053 RepID=UPI0032B46733